MQTARPLPPPTHQRYPDVTPTCKVVLELAVERPSKPRFRRSKHTASDHRMENIIPGFADYMERVLLSATNR